MINPLHRYTYIGKAEIFVAKRLEYKVVLLLTTQGDIQSIEQEILPVKAKPDRPIQNFD